MRLAPLMARARALRADERGVAALFAALTLPLLLGVGAFAVDIANYRYTANRMQTAVDAAALAGVQVLDKPSTVTRTVEDIVGQNVPPGYGTVTRDGDIETGAFDPNTRVFTVTSVEPNAVRVTAIRSVERGNAPRVFLGIIFGGDAVKVRTSAVAARSRDAQYSAPTVKSLNPNAGDFNELYVYCFDYKGGGTAASRRSQMTLIANNDTANAVVKASNGAVKSVPDPITWPRCGEGESLSLSMRNIRHVKSQPQLWNNPNATVCLEQCGTAKAVNRQIGRAEHTYFTDTSIASGLETYHLGATMLETVSCETETCAAEVKNGTIPTGGNRAPKVDTSVCVPGKFRYFGWEDRPPGQAGASKYWTDPAWTDKDYDDVRIVMPCPKTGKLGSKNARLVR